MIETVLSKFRSLSKEYSNMHFRLTQRTMAFKIYFFSTLSFLILFLITLWLFANTASSNIVIKFFVVSLLLLGISLVSDKFAKKHLNEHCFKKNQFVKVHLKEYLRIDHRIFRAEQMKHLSTMISKAIQYKKKHYKFNPSYFSIVLAAIIGFSKFLGDGNLKIALGLFISFLFIFAIAHIFLTERTNYLNLKVEKLEEMLGVIDEITLEMLIDHQDKNSVTAKKKR